MTELERITEIAKSVGAALVTEECEPTYVGGIHFYPHQLLAFSQTIREDEVSSFAAHRRDEIAEANAQHEAILAKRDEEHAKEITRLKSVPMKYRRMEFNAQLQKEIDHLKTQLAMQADATKHYINTSHAKDIDAYDEVMSALSATSEDVARYKSEIEKGVLEEAAEKFRPTHKDDTWLAYRVQVELQDMAKERGGVR